MRADAAGAASPSSSPTLTVDTTRRRSPAVAGQHRRPPRAHGHRGDGTAAAAPPEAGQPAVALGQPADRPHPRHRPPPPPRRRGAARRPAGGRRRGTGRDQPGRGDRHARPRCRAQRDAPGRRPGSTAASTTSTTITTSCPATWPSAAAPHPARGVERARQQGDQRPAQQADGERRQRRRELGPRRPGGVVAGQQQGPGGFGDGDQHGRGHPRGGGDDPGGAADGRPVGRPVAAVPGRGEARVARRRDRHGEHRPRQQDTPSGPWSRRRRDPRSCRRWPGAASPRRPVAGPRARRPRRPRCAGRWRPARRGTAGSAGAGRRRAGSAATRHAGQHHHAEGRADREHQFRTAADRGRARTPPSVVAP